MYINFWYPMVTSEEVTSYEPFRTTVLGLKSVAFRILTIFYGGGSA